MEHAAGTLLKHCEQHGNPGAFQPAGGTPGLRIGALGEERLDLSEQGPATLHGHCDAGSGDGLPGPRNEQPAGIGQPLDAGLVKIKATDVVRGAIAVFYGPQQPQAGVALAFELAYDIHKVFQQTRPCDGAFLGHMANQQRCHVASLGRRDDGRRNLAYLRDTTGASFDVGAAERLHRVHDQQLGLKLLHLAQCLPKVGLGGQIQRVRDGVDPLRPELHLCCGFLARNVEDILPGAGKFRGDVQQQCGLPDAGFPSQQDDGTGNEPSSKDAVQLVHTRGQECRRCPIHLSDPAGRLQNCCGRRRTRNSGAVLLNRSPSLALTAPAHPLDGRPAAFGAFVGGCLGCAGGLGSHGFKVSRGG
ncbi:hypothetical protein StoSoilB13_41410 (plasmid) [Arthrobacter sp. StoSoilB13]|nr:hypothetical protein StoSoilB13_41410 [Arthrobacter sp. StoSoilB13]